jgi:hypothetical protein
LTSQKLDGDKMKNFYRSKFFYLYFLIATIFFMQGCSSYKRNLSLANPTPIHRINNTEQTGAYNFNDASLKAANIAPSLYYESLRKVQINPNDQNKIDDYVKNGINLVKIYCNRWFLTLGEAQRNLQLTDTNRNVLTQFATALIGLGKLHSDVTTLWGAGTATVAGFNANINTAFLVSPNTENVEKLTMDALEGREKVLLSKTSDIYPKNFSDAIFQIENFAGICTYEKIRRLVTQSVAQSKPSVDKNSGEITIVSLSTVASNAQGTIFRDRTEALLEKINKISTKEILQFMKFVPQFNNEDYIAAAKKYSNRFDNPDAAREFARHAILATTSTEEDVSKWETSLKKLSN